MLDCDCDKPSLTYFRHSANFSTVPPFWQVAWDSRVFGPVPIRSIWGRVIYSLRTSVDHGPVQNRFVPCYVQLSLIPYCRVSAFSLSSMLSFLVSANSRSAMEQDSPVVAVELDLQALVNIANKWLKK